MKTWMFTVYQSARLTLSEKVDGEASSGSGSLFAIEWDSAIKTGGRNRIVALLTQLGSEV